MEKFVLLFLLLLPEYAQPAELTTGQQELLTTAYHYGNNIDYPETIQAILLVESSANKHIRVGDIKNGFGRRSYGVMQIKLNTALFVIKPHENWKFLKNINTEEELLVKLITDTDFNIAIGTLYFRYLIRKFKNWKMAVVAYNRGEGWLMRNKNKVKNHSYLLKVKKYIHKIVRPFNINHNFSVAK